MMTTELKQISDGLPEGARSQLAEKFGCHPSKITLALKGLVRNPGFMNNLIREANKIIRQTAPAA